MSDLEVMTVERGMAWAKADDYEAVILRIIRLFGSTPWVDQEDRDAIEDARQVIHRHTGERPQ